MYYISSLVLPDFFYSHVEYGLLGLVSIEKDMSPSEACLSDIKFILHGQANIILGTWFTYPLITTNIATSRSEFSPTTEQSIDFALVAYSQNSDS